MAQSKLEADKMLDVYIYDYLMKRNLQATAKVFLSEGNVATDPVISPGQFNECFNNPTYAADAGSEPANCDLSVLQRSLPVDPSLYGQNIMQAKPGLSGVGQNQGVSSLPLKGWPLTDIDQLRSNLGVLKQFVASQSQVQLMSPRQQFLAQAQAQDVTNSGEMGPQGFRSLPGGGFTSKDVQPNGNDGSIGSPVQSSSSKVLFPRDEFVKLLIKCIASAKDA